MPDRRQWRPEALVYHPPIRPSDLSTAMRKALTLSVLVALTSACGIVYRQPVFQGALLEQKNVEQLKEGMSHQQVFTLLGSPPVADPLHQNRWDYVSTQRRRHGEMEVKNLTLWFEGDSLTRWEGEYFPEQDQALATELREKFGNLPKDKDKKQRR